MVQHWDLVHNMTTLYKTLGEEVRTLLGLHNHDLCRSTKCLQHIRKGTRERCWTGSGAPVTDQSCSIERRRASTISRSYCLQKLVNDRTTTSFSKHCKLSIREWSREGRRGRPLWSAILSVSAMVKTNRRRSKKNGPKRERWFTLNESGLDWIGFIQSFQSTGIQTIKDGFKSNQACICLYVQSLHSSFPPHYLYVYTQTATHKYTYEKWNKYKLVKPQDED